MNIGLGHVLIQDTIADLVTLDSDVSQPAVSAHGTDATDRLQEARRKTMRRCCGERQHTSYGNTHQAPLPNDWLQVHIVGFNGGPLDSFSEWEDVCGQGIVAWLAKRLGADSATLALAHGRQPVQSSTSHIDQRICTGAVLTLTRLRVPPEHDGVQYCDSCDFVRYCHYGYTWSSATMRYEAVIAHCEPCGGKHINTEALDDDESVSERSSNQEQSPMVLH
jgi:hypothetical protein